jgi:hypothetical protein
MHSRSVKDLTFRYGRLKQRAILALHLKIAALVPALLASGATAPVAPQRRPEPLELRSPVSSESAEGSWLLGLDEGPLSKRVLDASARFLGTPYIHSPLGEGTGVDPDPIMRFDAVDCLTFVEETLALSIAHSPTEVVPLLLQLRYAHTPTYEDRNHLMEAEWLPNNVRKGFLRDITRAIGGAATVRAPLMITPRSWNSPSSRLLKLPKARQITGGFELDMLPLGAALALSRQFPPGAILLVVREDHPWKVTRITHLGFVVQKSGRAFLRHAARSRYRRVVDEDLAAFLSRNATYAGWRVSGIALYEPRVPELGAADLAASAAVGQIGPP